MYILGINAYHGDASAAIVRDGQLIAAVEEERLNRIKHCAGFPVLAVRYCLAEARISAADLDHVGISRNPSAHLHKKILFSLGKVSKLSGFLRSRLANAARVRSLKDDLAQALAVPASDFRARFHNVEHHKAHMASCFLVSPFDRSAILSIDGFGDFVSTMWGYGEGADIKVLGQVEFPHSLGTLYSATSQYLGFPKYGDEGKVMGLAPYGEPRYIEQFRDIIATRKDGSFRLNLDYFLHHSEGVDMTWDNGSPTIGRLFSNKFIQVFGPARQKGAALDSKHQDIAASLQLRLEEVVFNLLRHLHEQTGSTRLCLAGGVVFNSVMNGKIPLETGFTQLYPQAAAGDAGTALGVCYYLHNVQLKQPRSFVMEHAYTGPAYGDGELEQAIRQSGLPYTRLQPECTPVLAARAIAEGQIVGWFQGRVEFGPRALGNRSIVVDPRRPEMKDVLNARIKKRESFRPFAPSILEERVGEYFEQTHPSPSMLMVYQIRPEKRAAIPAVTHIDGSGRLQTVSRSVNPRYYELINEFEKLTGVPVVLNTSFNEDEPIVCSPHDALNCFARTRMDKLFLGDFLVDH